MALLPPDQKYMQSGTRARFSISDTSSLQMTFGLTMTMPEWVHLASQLPEDGSAAGQLGKMIRRMVMQSAQRMGATYETTGYSEPVACDKEPAA